MELRLFHMTDFDAIIPLEKQNPVARKIVYHLAINGTSYAAYNGTDVPLAVGGGLFSQPGVAQVWLIASEHGKRHPRQLLQAVRGVVDKLMDGTDLRRMETTIDPTDTKAVRFAEFLGFQREGCRRKGGLDGRDEDWYAMVRD